MNAVRVSVQSLAAMALMIGAAVAQAETLDARLADAGWRVLPFGDKPPTRFDVDADGAIEVAAAGGAAFLYRPVTASEAAARRDDRPLAVHVFFAMEAERTGFLAGIWREMRARLFGAPFAGRLVTYMWGGTASAGTRLANPHLPDDGGIVVLRDGTALLSDWQDESVDLAADYRAAFGTPAPSPAYIAVSADADDLGGDSLGWVSDLALAPRIANGGG